MAKTTAPLLSFGASGAIAKTQVYSTWRGVPYARRYVTPANPNSVAQQHTRGVFSFLSNVWKELNAAVQAPWLAFSKGQKFTDRNAFTSKNVRVLRGVGTDYPTDLTGIVMSPGANGGLAAVAITTADATGHVATVTLTAPVLPAGWTITAQHAVCLPNDTAWDATSFQSFYATDVTTPYAAAVDCGSAGDFMCVSFFEYVKPDGSTAYSPSLAAPVTLA